MARFRAARSTYGVPLMLIAVGTEATILFAIAGPLLAAALSLFLLTIAPMIRGLPVFSRTAIAGAIAVLFVGVSLGAVFAIFPETGPAASPRSCPTEPLWLDGLLVCGVGYYLVPRFAGQPLRWPRLAYAQLGALGAGIVITAWGWIGDAHGPPLMTVQTVGHGLLALGFGLFGIIVAGTFRPRAPGVGASAPLEVRRTGVPVPRG